MTDLPMTAEYGVWRFVWNGGRTADVFHAESDTAQDCVQVGNYDWVAGKARHAGRRSLESAAREWLRDCADDHARNLS